MEGGRCTNLSLPSLIYSGGALVQQSVTPAAPVEQLTIQQYKAVKEVDSSQCNCVELNEHEEGLMKKKSSLGFLWKNNGSNN